MKFKRLLCCILSLVLLCTMCLPPIQVEAASSKEIQNQINQLKKEKDEIKDKIFKNMSERARQMLVDDMEYLGPVRAKEVQEAQTAIVNAIRTLEATGEITITRASVEDELIE